MSTSKFNLRVVYCVILIATILFLVKLVSETSYYANNYNVLEFKTSETDEHNFNYKIDDGNKMYNANTVIGTDVNNQVTNKQIQDVNNNNIKNETAKEVENQSKDDNKSLKYILQWTSPHNVPFKYMGVGQKAFIEQKCKYTNCYVTSNREYLGKDYTNFDAVVFAGPEVIHNIKLPEKRSPKQKFVFATIESAQNYPVCTNRLDGFFNWTWTYRLDSETKWGYIVIRDSKGNIVGPKKDMQWMRTEDMAPVSEELRNQLARKTKSVAWFVSNCFTLSHRETYVFKMEQEIKKQGYNMAVDIYGSCGKLKCSRDNEDVCEQMVERDYHFYLAFENSFSEDYVTEKLIHAAKNKAIPIVYGGANYSRFLPPGSYLNARELTPKELVTKMNELMNDLDKYTEYFRWTNHYSYHRRRESVETNDYCGFCTLLNDVQRMRETTVYHNFREWWNDSPQACLGS